MLFAILLTKRTLTSSRYKITKTILYINFSVICVHLILRGFRKRAERTAENFEKTRFKRNTETKCFNQIPSRGVGMRFQRKKFQPSANVPVYLDLCTVFEKKFSKTSSVTLDEMSTAMVSQMTSVINILCSL